MSREYSEDGDGGRERRSSRRGGFYESPECVFADGSSYMAVVNERGDHLTLDALDIDVEVQVTTAFVELVGRYMAKASGDYSLVLPINSKASLTSVTVRQGGRIFDTVVVSPELVTSLEKKHRYDRASQPPAPSLGYKDAFVFPLRGIQSGEEVVVDLCYLEALTYSFGEYRVDIPMRLPEELLRKKTLEDLILANVSIFSGTKSLKLKSSSHTLNVKRAKHHGSKIVEAEVEFDSRSVNGNLIISYELEFKKTQATLLVQGPDTSNTNDNRGTFVLFLTPPTGEGDGGNFPRKIFFLLDRSGSMGNTVMGIARQAIVQGLEELTSADFFNVNAFDDRDFLFAPAMVPATRDNVRQAIRWVEDIKSAAGTDILGPIRGALSQLEANRKHLPFIFLVTDGAVPNEREICKYVQLKGGDCRFMTFGIGRACNAHFLRMLALIGKGVSDVAVSQDKIGDQMERLLDNSRSPVMTDIGIRVEGIYDVEIYPFPIPDLYSSAPITIAGKYRGHFPNSVDVLGTDPKYGPVSIHAKRSHSGDVPIDRIFVKQRLDILVAEHWLTQDPKTLKALQELSMNEGVPCEHTSFVAYEIQDKDRLKAEDEKRQRERDRHNARAKNDRKNIHYSYSDESYEEDDDDDRRSDDGRGARKGGSSGKGHKDAWAESSKKGSKKGSKKASKKDDEDESSEYYYSDDDDDDDDKKKGKKASKSGGSSGKKRTREDGDKRSPSKKKGGMSAGTAVLLGAAMVVGGGAIAYLALNNTASFGSVAATAQNLPSISLPDANWNMPDLNLGSGFDVGPCCDVSSLCEHCEGCVVDLGNCNFDGVASQCSQLVNGIGCSECQSCANNLCNGNCAGAVGDLGGQVAHTCSNIGLDSCGNGCNSLIGNCDIGAFVGDIGSQCSSCVSGAGNCDCASQLVNTVVGSCGDLGTACDLSNCGSCIGNVASCAGDLASCAAGCSC